MINDNYLNECFNYNGETGFLVWKERPRHHFRTEKGWRVFNSQKAGKAAGCASMTSDGMVYIKVRLNKRLYLAHRLAWQMMHGEIPGGMEIDHVDHDGSNNAKENLRIVTSSENKRNRSMVKTNRSGQMGVYWNASLKKWVAEILCNGKHYSLGVHENIRDAVGVRKKREIELGFHPNHGI